MPFSQPQTATTSEMVTLMSLSSLCKTCWLPTRAAHPDSEEHLESYQDHYNPSDNHIIFHHHVRSIGVIPIL